MKRAVLAMAMAVALVPIAARADDEPPKFVDKTATFTWETTLLRMTLSYRDVVDDEIAKKLTSGVPTVIVMLANVLEEGGSTPVGFVAKSCRIVFDPWDEVYRVQVAQAGGETTSIAATLDGVLRRCAEAQKLPVIDRSRLDAEKRYFVKGKVEVNPISKEILERIKKWVSRPAGASSIGAGDALFGSFVGLFVARIGSADRELRFQTQLFTVPPPPPP